MEAPQSSLWDLGLKTIQELETEKGILASSREELYGCIFGRDSFITSLKLLNAYRKTKNSYFLNLVRKTLISLASLQGKDVNIESGEEPGKCIHEFRSEGHEHLTGHPFEPWYLYPDGMMRNYDSVDSTPLFLICVYRYYQVSGDKAIIQELQANIQAALNWLLSYGDSNKDGFIDYHFSPDRKHGGLRAQNWMDSTESLFHEDGQKIEYPLAPVEIQAYAYLALKLWGLNKEAKELKNKFNQVFISGDQFASALNGNGNIIASTRSTLGHCLWAAQTPDQDNILDCVMENNNIPQLVKRLMAEDLFVPQAGIRTLSSQSNHFDPYSYHNGSIWPHDNAIIIEGLENFGFNQEAQAIKKAIISAFKHFKTPLELFTFVDGAYGEYRSPTGQTACRKQAWSAASLLSLSAV